MERDSDLMLDPAALAPLPPGATLSTQEAAALSGLTEATLRNYAWLLSITADEREQRRLQKPPEGLPQPSRARGHLRWPAAEFARFVAQHKS